MRGKCGKGGGVQTYTINLLYVCSPGTTHTGTTSASSPVMLPARLARECGHFSGKGFRVREIDVAVRGNPYPLLCPLAGAYFLPDRRLVAPAFVQFWRDAGYPLELTVPEDGLRIANAVARAKLLGY